MTETDHLSTDPLAAFERERGRLFGIAYRMLGSVAEAEDVLQDAWLRWQGVEHGMVENPAAYLVRLVTRLSIDTLGAARNRLTDYVGPWLPEPIVGRRVESLSEDPGDGDMDGMVALLAQDATLYSDGGGKVKAAQKPIHGAESIARFLVGIRRQGIRTQVAFELRPAIVNGRTGFVTLVEGRPYNVFALDTEPGRIRGVYVVANPDKLGRIEI